LIAVIFVQEEILVDFYHAAYINPLLLLKGKKMKIFLY